MGRPRRVAGQRARPHVAAGPPRPGHLARRGAPGRGPPAQPAPGGPRPAPLALGPPRRRAARRGPARRVDLRLRRGQPGGALRRHGAGRERGRPRPGLLLHLRLRLLPAPLRRHRGHGDVGRHTRPRREVVDGTAGAVPPPHDGRPARRPRPHHPRRRRHAAPGAPRRGAAARQRPQHARPDGDDRRRTGAVRRRAARVLRLPLPRPGPPVDAAHQGRLLPLSRRERAQRRPGPRPRPPARGPRPRPLPVHRLHRRRRPGPGGLPPVVRSPGRAPDLGAVVARRRGLRAHGRGRARRVQPLGVDERRRAAGPGGGRHAGRRPHLCRGRGLAGAAPRRPAAAAAGPGAQPVRAPRRRRGGSEPPPRACSGGPRGRLRACPASTS